jgi:hypothetical protein
VQQGDRNDFAARDLEGSSVQLVQRQMRPGVRRIGSVLKGVQEHSSQGVEGALRAKTWHRLFRQPIEAAKIIQADDMIGVIVREKHSVDAFDLVGDALQAQLGRRIHQDVQVAKSHKNARPRSLISRIIGRANRAFAADHGHAVRRAGSQNNDFKIRHSVHSLVRRPQPIIRQVNAHDQLQKGAGHEIACNLDEQPNLADNIHR